MFWIARQVSYQVGDFGWRKKELLWGWHDLALRTQGHRFKAARTNLPQRPTQQSIRRATEAKARAEQLAPVIRELQQRHYSMRGIVVELDKRKVPTPRGGAWHPQLVKRIVQRLEAHLADRAS